MMKEKKAGLKLIYASFVVIICLSWVLWFFLEKYVDTTNYENRQMNAQPRLALDTYRQFPTEYNKYLNDNLPFRNSLIKLNNSIDYHIFKRSTDNRVVIGSDGWLFYCAPSDGDPIACYQGSNLLSEEQLASFAANCIKQRDYLASQGIEFVIFVAPNKERVYFEKMPERYGQPSERYQVLQIVNYLKANTDLRVVYPYDQLMRTKTVLEENIYYKTDTHWNSIGGYVGSCALLSELGIRIPEFDSDQIKILPSEECEGDLAGFLGLTKQLKKYDHNYSVEGYDTHQVRALDGDEEYYKALRYTAKGADPRKLYVVRDSFATAMFPFLSSQFNESCFRHWSSYSYEDFESQRPDVFVYETVERFIGRLSSFSVQ